MGCIYAKRKGNLECAAVSTADLSDLDSLSCPSSENEFKDEDSSNFVSLLKQFLSEGKETG
jgi:hypothetical protein